jgi:superfamily II DNA/RNA helicase
VTILSDASHKWRWLVEAVETYVSEGKILVFVGSRADTDELAAKLNAHFSARQLLIGLDCIHGDR